MRRGENHRMRNGCAHHGSFHRLQLCIVLQQTISQPTFRNEHITMQHGTFLPRISQCGLHITLILNERKLLCIAQCKGVARISGVACCSTTTSTKDTTDKGYENKWALHPALMYFGVE